MSQSVLYKASEVSKEVKRDAKLKVKAKDGESVQVLRIKDKLKRIESFKEMDDEALTAEVDNHVNPEAIGYTFSHLYDPEEVLDDALEEAEAYSDGLQTHEEEQLAKAAADRRHSHAAHLPVYLYFSKLQRLEEKGVAVRAAGALFGRYGCKYGPLHAALMVGDVILEWNSSSLVVPQRRGAFKPVFRVGLQQHHNYWLDVVTKRRSEMSAHTSDGVVHYGEQIGCLIDIHTERKKLVDELIRMVVKYNKFYHYHLFARNCQHFVNDAMKALGITANPTFTGEMREYYERLRKSLSKGTPSEFETHVDLDRYVIENLTTLSHEQLQFMYCQYLNFHTMAGMEEPSTWKCAKSTCQALIVDERMETIEKEGLRRDNPASSDLDGTSSTVTP